MPSYRYVSASISLKENNKLSKYKDLKIETEMIWHKKYHCASNSGGQVYDQEKGRYLDVAVYTIYKKNYTSWNCSSP